MSGQQDWRTPKWLFDLLRNKLFSPFDLDAFASRENALCERFYTAEDNALVHPWAPKTFANPPFTMMCAALEKACVERSFSGHQTRMLGPSGCSQGWFHAYALQGSIYCPDTRIAFDHPDGTPSTSPRGDVMIYVIGPEVVRGAVFPLAVKELQDAYRKVTRRSDQPSDTELGQPAHKLLTTLVRVP